MNQLYVYMYIHDNIFTLCIEWASQVALVVKIQHANAEDLGDAGSTPGLERSPGGGHGNPFQYSCLENPWTEEPSKLQSIGSQRVGHD